MNGLEEIYLHIRTGNDENSPYHADILYYISTINSKIDITKIYAKGELDISAFSTDKNKIVLLEGQWTQQNEKHFDNHHYRVTEFIYENNRFKQINLGITKNRYALNGESTALNDLFIDIQSKEPEILQSINISDFVNGQIF